MKRYKKFQSPEIRQLIEMIKRSPPPARAPKQLIVYRNFESILSDICYGLSADQIAAKYDIGERTFWRFLERYGYTKDQIERLCQKEEAFRKMSAEEKRAEKEQRLLAPASDKKSLKRMLSWINDLKYTVSESTLDKYVNVWLELCQFADKHPSKITLNDIKEFIQAKKIEWKEKGLDINRRSIQARFSSEYITPIRVFCKFQGIPITPILKTAEYESPYRSVRINVDQRFCILKYLYENYPDEYEYLKGIVFLLYYNGHRASELTRIEYEPREYYVVIRTWGKKGLEYEKILPKYVLDEVIEVLENPPSQKKLIRIRKIMKEAYRQCLKKGTITYKYALEIKALHVWRHTACNDLIDFTGYNLGIIMKTLGWKNPKMIVQVYGEVTLDQIARFMGWIKAPRTQFDYIYNKHVFDEHGREVEVRPYLDEAYKQEMIGEDYYYAVKKNTEVLIDEFKQRLRRK